jgi:hypothetical protein
MSSHVKWLDIREMGEFHGISVLSGDVRWLDIREVSVSELL